MNILNVKDLIQYKGLWHSIKKEHLNLILDNNYLESRTTQRYWKNGVVLRDDDRDAYQESFYMKGWSTSRDKFYSLAWSGITLLLDESAIRRDFKVKPISWNYRNACCKVNFDKEREEFILSNFIDQTFEEIKQEYFDITDRIYDDLGKDALKKWQSENGTDFIFYMKRKGTKKIDLNKYLIGIFIDRIEFDIYKGKGYEKALNHPLFKGFISGDECRRIHDGNMKKQFTK